MHDCKKQPEGVSGGDGLMISSEGEPAAVARKFLPACAGSSPPQIKIGKLNLSDHIPATKEKEEELKQTARLTEVETVANLLKKVDADATSAVRVNPTGVLSGVTARLSGIIDRVKAMGEEGTSTPADTAGIQRVLEQLLLLQEELEDARLATGH